MDSSKLKFICFEKELIRLHCQVCNCVFFNKMLPKKPKYDYAYNLNFFKTSDYDKAKIMSTKLITLAKSMSENPTFFEIGVGNGWTLGRLQKAGIESKGVDVDEALCSRINKTQGITVYPGGLEKLKITERYDLVYSSHVIEHFELPDLFMLKAKQLVKEKGILYLDTPNLDDSSSLNPDWHHFKTRHPWEHCCVLSPKALGVLAGRHGLKVIKIELHPEFGSFQAILQRV
jgi:2-polyprenyl-3-methyl-5-hydroxy-6-metoxy-1,4-benzoquinol methylase